MGILTDYLGLNKKKDLNSKEFAGLSNLQWFINGWKGVSIKNLITVLLSTIFIMVFLIIFAFFYSEISLFLGFSLALNTISSFLYLMISCCSLMFIVMRILKNEGFIKKIFKTYFKNFFKICAYFTIPVLVLLAIFINFNNNANEMTRNVLLFAAQVALPLLLIYFYFIFSCYYFIYIFSENKDKSIGFFKGMYLSLKIFGKTRKPVLFTIILNTIINILVFFPISLFIVDFLMEYVFHIPRELKSYYGMIMSIFVLFILSSILIMVTLRIIIKIFNIAEKEVSWKNRFIGNNKYKVGSCSWVEPEEDII